MDISQEGVVIMIVTCMPRTPIQLTLLSRTSLPKGLSGPSQLRWTGRSSALGRSGWLERSASVRVMYRVWALDLRDVRSTHNALIGPVVAVSQNERVVFSWRQPMGNPRNLRHPLKGPRPIGYPDSPRFVSLPHSRLATPRGFC
jgi:hypothetical protein